MQAGKAFWASLRGGKEGDCTASHFRFPLVIVERLIVFTLLVRASWSPNASRQSILGLSKRGRGGWYHGTFDGYARAGIVFLSIMRTHTSVNSLSFKHTYKHAYHRLAGNTFWAFSNDIHFNDVPSHVKAQRIQKRKEYIYGVPRLRVISYLFLFNFSYVLLCPWF